GEGLPADDRLGQPELTPDGTDLVLEQQPQRLDERELDVVGQATDVVVTLDVGRAGSAAGFDDVRVERALDQEVDGRVRTLDRSLLLDRLRDRPLEGADELAADDLALGLRVGDAGEVPEVGLGLVERDERSE